MDFATLDLVVFLGYLLGIMGFGIWIANRQKNTTSQDYFLASNTLPWWAVGGSLIASNISTEQIMGMNGSGFELGMAIASYELMAAVTLLIVAKFFLPIFLKKGIYTMPQFLEQRYDQRTRSLMSIFWVALFVFVNITSVLYLGGLAIQSLLGVPLLVGIFGLVIYSATFSIFGGLKAVVWTDVAQLVVLIIGGLVASVTVVSAVGGDGDFFAGLSDLFEKTPERFEMIFEPGDMFYSVKNGQMESSYSLLPGLSVLLGGMWIANLYYWGNNQYIIQRALASKTLKEAQRGVAFAAFLKIFMPLIVVIPGIAAFVLNADLTTADEAFPWVLNNYVGIGLKGLVFAALVAAIGSSISSMVNSASTIFTLDIYKEHINKMASESRLVRVGQISAAVSLMIGAALGPMLSNFGQVVQFIQEYTGFISPGVVAIFIFGMFWKRTTANAAFVVVLISIPLSTAFKLGLPDLPFMDRMGISFLICSITLIVISLLEQKQQKAIVDDKKFRFGLIIAIALIALTTGLKIIFDDLTVIVGGSDVGSGIGYLTVLMAVVAVGLLWWERKADDVKAIELNSGLFHTDTVFTISAFAICLILAFIYATLG